MTVEQLAGFDAVMHLAALSNDPLGALAPGDHLRHQPPRVGTAGPAGQGRGCARFLYASTCSVYGAAGDELVDEDAPLRPLTPYADSKVRVEDDVAAIADRSLLPVFLRNATAFGFSPRLRADIVLNNLVGHAVLTGEVRVLSDGTPWRPLVHARDIAAAFATAWRRPIEQVHCRAYNVGTEANNVTVAEIAECGGRRGARCRAAHHRRDGRRSTVLPGGLLRGPRRTRLRGGVAIADGAAELYARIHRGRVDRPRISRRGSPGCPTGGAARRRRARRSMRGSATDA